MEVRGVGSLEVVLEAVVSCLMLVLETERTRVT